RPVRSPRNPTKTVFKQLFVCALSFLSKEAQTWHRFVRQKMGMKVGSSVHLASTKKNASMLGVF
ncbi:MAG: hypothetical protein ACO4CS_18150, partial [bacterium]